MVLSFCLGFGVGCWCCFVYLGVIVGIVLLGCASGWCEFFVFVVVGLVGLHVCGICSLMWFRAWSLGVCVCFAGVGVCV